MFKIQELTANPLKKRAGYLLIKKSFCFVKLNFNCLLIDAWQFKDGQSKKCFFVGPSEHGSTEDIRQARHITICLKWWRKSEIAYVWYHMVLPCSNFCKIYHNLQYMAPEGNRNMGRTPKDNCMLLLAINHEYYKCVIERHWYTNF